MLTPGQRIRAAMLPKRHRKILLEIAFSKMPQYELAHAVDMTPFELNLVEQGFATVGWKKRRKIRRAIASWAEANGEVSRD